MRKTNEISFVAIDNKFDTEIEKGINEGLPWDAFKEILADCDRRDDKEGPAFIPVVFKDRSEWVLNQVEDGKKPSFRHEENVNSISMIVFDLDEEGAFEKAEKLFNDFEYVVYSTHSYSKEKPYKLRIVLPLAEEITPEQWKKSFDTIKHSINADGQCGDLSRCYYFSSMTPNSGIEPYYQHNEGTIISYGLLQKAAKKYISELPAEEQQRIEDEIKNDEKKHREFKEKARLTNFGPVLASGEVSNFSKKNTASNLDMSYEGFKSRHDDRINELVNNGSNYQFCRDVCFHEVLRSKDNADFRLLVQFIVRASVEYSGDQSVIHKQGSNTLGEFPSNVTSAIGKIDRNLLASFGPDFKNQLYAYVQQAKHCQKNNKWDFPAGSYTRTKANVPSEVVSEDTEAAMRQKFKPLLGQFFKNIEQRRVVRLFSDIVHQELSLNKEGFNINKLSEFTFMQLERAYIKGFGVNKPQVLEMLSEDASLLYDNQDAFLNMIKAEKPKFREGFFANSINKALLCSKGELPRSIKSGVEREYSN